MRIVYLITVYFKRNTICPVYIFNLCFCLFIYFFTVLKWNDIFLLTNTIFFVKLQIIRLFAFMIEAVC